MTYCGEGDYGACLTYLHLLTDFEQGALYELLRRRWLWCFIQHTHTRKQTLSDELCMTCSGQVTSTQKRTLNEGLCMTYCGEGDYGFHPMYAQPETVFERRALCDLLRKRLL